MSDLKKLIYAEVYLTDRLVSTIEQLKKVAKSESMVYTTAGGYFERQKDLLMLEHKRNRLRAMLISTITEYNKLTKN